MSLKTWTQRFADYDAGAAISKSLINALASVVRGQRPGFDPELVKLARKRTDYENVWGKTPGWAITPEQTTQGLEWLNRRPIKKHLEPGDLAILEAFDHFVFKGYEIVDRTTHSAFPRLTTRPVYRVISKSGAWFDYASSPWQDGGDPFTVLSRGKK